MREQVQERTAKLPSQVLADSDHMTHEAVREASREGLELVAPVPEKWMPIEKVTDPDIRAFQQRMATPEAKEIYRGRKALSERPNSTIKDRFGLDRLPVRGIPTVTCFMLLGGVIHNILEFGCKLLA